ncbi:MAG TPA: class F sortase [Candidatus Paceibacterota bacterium]|nr:class F sortase [Candidatus Paceibacterota bacterium]
MRKIVGFVVLVSAAVLLGAHLEVTKTLADSTDPLPIEITTAPEAAQIPTNTPAIASTTITDTAVALSTAQVTTTAQALPPAPKKAAVIEPAAKSESQKDEFKAKIEPKQATLGSADQYPVRLIIPSIGLNAPIEAVGVNAKGEMAVPDGSSNNIGWYKGGPMPGSAGSAVLDAHVFAALKDLRYVKVGEPVYVLTKGGTRLRFIVKESTVYSLSEITPSILFDRSGGQWLNIITCAGQYVPALGTYDHRLVDFALFDGEELD